MSHAWDVGFVRSNESAGGSSGPRCAVPSLSRTLKKAAPEGASGQHRKRKEERRVQPENSLRRGRAECVARRPPAVAGASLGNLWNGPH